MAKLQPKAQAEENGLTIFQETEFLEWKEK
jgi:hypothetical protein